MIDAVLLMRHCDIINIILGLIFNMLQFNHTYDVCTYVNDNYTIRPLLCYSSVCGIGNNVYGMSEYLIKYFDMIHDVNDSKEFMKMMKLCGNNWLIDSERKLYLLKISTCCEMIEVGGMDKFGISRVVYVIGNRSKICNFNVEHVNSQLKIVCVTNSEFYKFVTRGLGLYSTKQSVDVRSHHILVNGLLR